MELIDIIEFCILFGGIYYLYDISTSYLPLKTRSEFFNRYSILIPIAILGDIAMILNFQLFWLTSFFENHRYFEIFVKIALAILSIANQFLVYELDEEKHKIKTRKKGKSEPYYIYDGKLGFKILNRLFLLIIIYKFFNRNPITETE